MKALELGEGEIVDQAFFFVNLRLIDADKLFADLADMARVFLSQEEIAAKTMFESISSGVFQGGHFFSSSSEVVPG